jgi:hypothetical protein
MQCPVLPVFLDKSLVIPGCVNSVAATTTTSRLIVVVVVDHSRVVVESVINYETNYDYDYGICCSR